MPSQILLLISAELREITQAVSYPLSVDMDYLNEKKKVFEGANKSVSTYISRLLESRMFSEEEIAMMDRSREYFGEKMHIDGSIKVDDNSATTTSKLRVSHWSFTIDILRMKNIYFLSIYLLFTILLTCSPLTHCYGKANIRLEELTPLSSFRLTLYVLPRFSLGAVNMFWSWPPLWRLYSSKSFLFIIKSDSVPFG